MSRSDAGYSKTRSGGGGGRKKYGMTYSKWLQRSYKDDADWWVSKHLSGILDVLDIEPDTDEAHEIAEGIRPDKESKSKEEMYQDLLTLQDETAVTTRTKAEQKRLHSARLILDALSSASRRTERVDLDDGDDIGDVVNAMIDGGGWEIETNTARQYKKHVNICVDNSGSTHTAMTGFCAKAMLTVVNELAGALHSARKQYPNVTYDIVSYNKSAKMHTGREAHEEFDQNVKNYFNNVEVDDPTVVQARETNLAPLMKKLHDNERDRGIDAPIIDIILTDGEWESDEDVAKAAMWQSRRSNVTTYVLNLCPDEVRHDDDGNVVANIALPNHFRMIPLRCVTDNDNAVDKGRIAQREADAGRITQAKADDMYVDRVANAIRLSASRAGKDITVTAAREMAEAVVKDAPKNESGEVTLKQADDQSLHTAMMQIVTSELGRK